MTTFACQCSYNLPKNQLKSLKISEITTQNEIVNIIANWRQLHETTRKFDNGRKY
jgi:hypothetical protein